MASYTATFDHLYRDTNFNTYHARYYKITSTTSVPAVNTDFTVTFPSLTSSQYVNSTSDACWLGFGSSGTYGQYQLADREKGDESVQSSYTIPISGGTFSFRRVGYYDVVSSGTTYIYNLSSNYSSPPKISNVMTNSGKVGTLITECDVNWGAAISGSVDCTIRYTLDGTTYSYSCYTKKFTNGYNLSLTPTSSSQWRNYTPSASGLDRTYAVVIKVADIFGTDYYKGTTKYWEIYPEGTNATITWTITTSEGTATQSAIQEVSDLWNLAIIDSEHPGTSYALPDDIKSSGVRQSTGAINNIRRFRLIG